MTVSKKIQQYEKFKSNFVQFKEELRENKNINYSRHNLYKYKPKRK